MTNMQNEFFERLLNTLENISANLEPMAFWADWDFWSLVALIITLIFLIRYTRATEKIMEYQMMPAIDVNMCYDSVLKKTYFWFSNHSYLGGFVHLKFKKNNDKKKEVYPPLRIAPKERAKKTATAFDFSPVERDKMTLYISIHPSLKDSDINFEFEKSYKFSGNQWKESTWAFPDPQFPG